MSTETTVPPVRRSVEVTLPTDRAFALFTGRIADWWPGGSSVSGASPETSGTVVLEPRVGGHVYRRADDGTTETWGQVVVWEAPNRLVLSWEPNSEAATTEVEVRFSSVPGGTRVDLEHRGWERLGDQAGGSRARYDSGWADVLNLYAAASHDNGAALASLILGITSVVIPLLGIIAAPFAIVLGVVGRRRARRGARRGGLATAGLTLGCIGLVLWGVILALGAGVIITSNEVDQEPVPSEQTR